MIHRQNNKEPRLQRPLALMNSWATACVRIRPLDTSRS